MKTRRGRDVIICLAPGSCKPFASCGRPTVESSTTARCDGLHLGGSHARKCDGIHPADLRSLCRSTVDRLANAIQWTGSSIAGAIAFGGSYIAGETLEASVVGGLLTLVGLPVLVKVSAKVRSVIQDAFTI